jgi:hypothetical protein
VAGVKFIMVGSNGRSQIYHCRVQWQESNLSWYGPVAGVKFIMVGSSGRTLWTWQGAPGFRGEKVSRFCRWEFKVNSTLCCDISQHIVVIYCRRFRKTYRCRLQGSRIVRNFSEERTSHLVHGGSLTPRNYLSVLECWCGWFCREIRMFRTKLKTSKFGVQHGTIYYLQPLLLCIEDRNGILYVILISVQQSTRRHILEDNDFYCHGRDNPRYLEWFLFDHLCSYVFREAVFHWAHTGWT